MTTGTATTATSRPVAYSTQRSPYRVGPEADSRLRNKGFRGARAPARDAVRCCVPCVVGSRRDA